MPWYNNAPMPTFSTAAKHSIPLTVLIAVIVGAACWQSMGDDDRYSAQKYRIQHFAAPPLPSGAGPEDYSTAEAAWSGLTVDSHGNLQIDARTETALTDAVALMYGPNAELAKERMAFLLEKQFGSAASRQIIELLPVLKRYKEMEQRWWADNGSKNPPPHAELFQLQDKLFGPALAKKMFSDQRRLATLMLRTQQIRNNAALTQAEKDQALQALQESLQAGEQ